VGRLLLRSRVERNNVRRNWASCRSKLASYLGTNAWVVVLGVYGVCGGGLRNCCLRAVLTMENMDMEVARRRDSYSPDRTRGVLLCMCVLQ